MKTSRKIKSFVVSLILLFSILVPTTNYQVFAKTSSPTHRATKTTTAKKVTKTKTKTNTKKTKKKTTTTKKTTKKKITSITPKKTSSSYTLADVAIHNYATSCWTTINGKVYNLTSWINQHPGGKQAILSLCGKNGTQAFNAQHGGQAKPEQELKNFLVGVLK